MRGIDDLPICLNRHFVFLSMITMMLHSKVHLPFVVEKDEDGFFVVECPILKGCYTQG